jgi:hypothetical protein
MLRIVLIFADDIPLFSEVEPLMYEPIIYMGSYTQVTYTGFESRRLI